MNATYVVRDSFALMLRLQIYLHMLRTRGRKYALFLISFMLFMWILVPERVLRLVMKSTYGASRRADDNADRDVELPAGYNSPLEYIEDRIRFIRNPTIPGDSADCLLLHAITLARSAGIEIADDLDGIFSSLQFDATRIDPGNPQVFPKRIMDEHHVELDVDRTAGLCLKLTREAEKGIVPRDLWHLCRASRMHLTLKDLPEEAAAGQWNICEEDMKRFGIRLLRNATREEADAWTREPATRAWQRKEARRGFRLLRIHRARMWRHPLRKLHWRRKFSLFVMYELPARLTFWRVLRNA